MLRIDSPGGDAVASATIWREIHSLRAAGKPVVASMGTVSPRGAAIDGGRGGEDRRCRRRSPADGVLAGQPDLSGFLRQQRGKVETIALGAEPRSVWRPLSSVQRARLNETIDAMYADFKSKVADGRGLSARRVEAAAKGRVWTGRQAKRRGLVDALGGTDEAVAIACAAAGLSAAVEVRPFPPAPTLAKVFESMGEEEEEGGGNGGGGGGGVGGAVGEVAAEAIEGAACAAAAAALRSTGLASLALALMHAEEAGAAVAAADGAQLMAEVPSV